MMSCRYRSPFENSERNKESFDDNLERKRLNITESESNFSKARSKDIFSLKTIYARFKAINSVILAVFNGIFESKIKNWRTFKYNATSFPSFANSQVEEYLSIRTNIQLESIRTKNFFSSLKQKKRMYFLGKFIYEKNNEISMISLQIHNSCDKKVEWVRSTSPFILFALKTHLYRILFASIVHSVCIWSYENSKCSPIAMNLCLSLSLVIEFSRKPNFSTLKFEILRTKTDLLLILALVSRFLVISYLLKTEISRPFVFNSKLADFFVSNKEFVETSSLMNIQSTKTQNRRIFLSYNIQYKNQLYLTEMNQDTYEFLKTHCKKITALKYVLTLCIEKNYLIPQLRPNHGCLCFFYVNSDRIELELLKCFFENKSMNQVRKFLFLFSVIICQSLNLKEELSKSLNILKCGYRQNKKSLIYGLCFHVFGPIHELKYYMGCCRSKNLHVVFQRKKDFLFEFKHYFKRLSHIQYFYLWIVNMISRFFICYSYHFQYFQKKNKSSVLKSTFNIEVYIRNDDFKKLRDTQHYLKHDLRPIDQKYIEKKTKLNTIDIQSCFQHTILHCIARNFPPFEFQRHKYMKFYIHISEKRRFLKWMSQIVFNIIFLGVTNMTSLSCFLIVKIKSKSYQLNSKGLNKYGEFINLSSVSRHSGSRFISNPIPNSFSMLLHQNIKIFFNLRTILANREPAIPCGFKHVGNSSFTKIIRIMIYFLCRWKKFCYVRIQSNQNIFNDLQMSKMILIHPKFVKIENPPFILRAVPFDRICQFKTTNHNFKIQPLKIPFFLVKVNPKIIYKKQYHFHPHISIFEAKSTQKRCPFRSYLIGKQSNFTDLTFFMVINDLFSLLCSYYQKFWSNFVRFQILVIISLKTWVCFLHQIYQMMKYTSFVVEIVHTSSVKPLDVLNCFFLKLINMITGLKTKLYDYHNFLYKIRDLFMDFSASKYQRYFISETLIPIVQNAKISKHMNGIIPRKTAKRVLQNYDQSNSKRYKTVNSRFLNYYSHRCISSLSKDCIRSYSYILSQNPINHYKKPSSTIIFMRKCIIVYKVKFPVGFVCVYLCIRYKKILHKKIQSVMGIVNLRVIPMDSIHLHIKKSRLIANKSYCCKHLRIFSSFQENLTFDCIMNQKRMYFFLINLGVQNFGDHTFGKRILERRPSLPLKTASFQIIEHNSNHNSTSFKQFLTFLERSIFELMSYLVKKIQNSLQIPYHLTRNREVFLFKSIYLPWFFYSHQVNCLFERIIYRSLAETPLSQFFSDIKWQKSGVLKKIGKEHINNSCLSMGVFIPKILTIFKDYLQTYKTTFKNHFLDRFNQAEQCMGRLIPYYCERLIKILSCTLCLKDQMNHYERDDYLRKSQNNRFSESKSVYSSTPLNYLLLIGLYSLKETFEPLKDLSTALRFINKFFDDQKNRARRNLNLKLRQTNFYRSVWNNFKMPERPLHRFLVKQRLHMEVSKLISIPYSSRNLMEASEITNQIYILPILRNKKFSCPNWGFQISQRRLRVYDFNRLSQIGKERYTRIIYHVRDRTEEYAIFKGRYETDVSNGSNNKRTTLFHSKYPQKQVHTSLYTSKNFHFDVMNTYTNEVYISESASYLTKQDFCIKLGSNNAKEHHSIHIFNLKRLGLEKKENIALTYYKSKINKIYGIGFSIRSVHVTRNRHNNRKTVYHHKYFLLNMSKAYHSKVFIIIRFIRHKSCYLISKIRLQNRLRLRKLYTCLITLGFEPKMCNHASIFNLHTKISFFEKAFFRNKIIYDFPRFLKLGFDTDTKTINVAYLFRGNAFLKSCALITEQNVYKLIYRRYYILLTMLIQRLHFVKILNFQQNYEDLSILNSLTYLPISVKTLFSHNKMSTRAHYFLKNPKKPVRIVLQVPHSSNIPIRIESANTRHSSFFQLFTSLNIHGVLMRLNEILRYPTPIINEKKIPNTRSKHRIRFFDEKMSICNIRKPLGILRTLPGYLFFRVRRRYLEFNVAISKVTYKHFLSTEMANFEKKCFDFDEFKFFIKGMNFRIRKSTFIRKRKYGVNKNNRPQRNFSCRFLKLGIETYIEHIHNIISEKRFKLIRSSKLRFRGKFSAYSGLKRSNISKNHSFSIFLIKKSRKFTIRDKYPLDCESIQNSLRYLVCEEKKGFIDKEQESFPKDLWINQTDITICSQRPSKKSVKKIPYQFFKIKYMTSEQYNSKIISSTPNSDNIDKTGPCYLQSGLNENTGVEIINNKMNCKDAHEKNEKILGDCFYDAMFRCIWEIDSSIKRKKCACDNRESRGVDRIVDPNSVAKNKIPKRDFPKRRYSHSKKAKYVSDRVEKIRPKTVLTPTASSNRDLENHKQTFKIESSSSHRTKTQNIFDEILKKPFRNHLVRDVSFYDVRMTQKATFDMECFHHQAVSQIFLDCFYTTTFKNHCYFQVPEIPRSERLLKNTEFLESLRIFLNINETIAISIDINNRLGILVPKNDDPLIFTTKILVRIITKGFIRKKPVVTFFKMLILKIAGCRLFIKFSTQMNMKSSHKTSLFLNTTSSLQNRTIYRVLKMLFYGLLVTKIFGKWCIKPQKRTVTQIFNRISKNYSKKSFFRVDIGDSTPMLDLFEKHNWKYRSLFEFQRLKRVKNCHQTKRRILFFSIIKLKIIVEPRKQSSLRSINARNPDSAEKRLRLGINRKSFFIISDTKYLVRNRAANEKPVDNQDISSNYADFHSNNFIKNSSTGALRNQYKIDICKIEGFDKRKMKQFGNFIKIAKFFKKYAPFFRLKSQIHHMAKQIVKYFNLFRYKLLLRHIYHDSVKRNAKFFFHRIPCMGRPKKKGKYGVSKIYFVDLRDKRENHPTLRNTICHILIRVGPTFAKNRCQNILNNKVTHKYTTVLAKNHHKNDRNSFYLHPNRVIFINDRISIFQSRLFSNACQFSKSEKCLTNQSNVKKCRLHKNQLFTKQKVDFFISKMNNSRKVSSESKKTSKDNEYICFCNLFAPSSDNNIEREIVVVVYVSREGDQVVLSGNKIFWGIFNHKHASMPYENLENIQYDNKNPISSFPREEKLIDLTSSESKKNSLSYELRKFQNKIPRSFKKKHFDNSKNKHHIHETWFKGDRYYLRISSQADSHFKFCTSAYKKFQSYTCKCCDGAFQVSTAKDNTSALFDEFRSKIHCGIEDFETYQRKGFKTNRKSAVEKPHSKKYFVPSQASHSNNASIYAKNTCYLNNRKSKKSKKFDIYDPPSNELLKRRSNSDSNQYLFKYQNKRQYDTFFQKFCLKGQKIAIRNCKHLKIPSRDSKSGCLKMTIENIRKAYNRTFEIHKSTIIAFFDKKLISATHPLNINIGFWPKLDLNLGQKTYQYVLRFSIKTGPVDLKIDLTQSPEKSNDRLFKQFFDLLQQIILPAALKNPSNTLYTLPTDNYNSNLSCSSEKSLYCEVKTGEIAKRSYKTAKFNENIFFYRYPQPAQRDFQNHQDCELFDQFKDFVIFSVRKSKFREKIDLITKNSLENGLKDISDYSHKFHYTLVCSKISKLQSNHSYLYFCLGLVYKNENFQLKRNQGESGRFFDPFPSIYLDNKRNLSMYIYLYLNKEITAAKIFLNPIRQCSRNFHHRTNDSMWNKFTNMIHIPGFKLAQSPIYEDFGLNKKSARVSIFLVIRIFYPTKTNGLYHSFVYDQGSDHNYNKKGRLTISKKFTIFRKRPSVFSKREKILKSVFKRAVRLLYSIKVSYYRNIAKKNIHLLKSLIIIFDKEVKSFQDRGYSALHSIGTSKLPIISMNAYKRKTKIKIIAIRPQFNVIKTRSSDQYSNIKDDINFRFQKIDCICQKQHPVYTLPCCLSTTLEFVMNISNHRPPSIFLEIIIENYHTANYFENSTPNNLLKDRYAEIEKKCLVNSLFILNSRSFQKYLHTCAQIFTRLVRNRTQDLDLVTIIFSDDPFDKLCDRCIFCSPESDIDYDLNETLAGLLAKNEIPSYHIQKILRSYFLRLFNEGPGFLWNFGDTSKNIAFDFRKPIDMPQIEHLGMEHYSVVLIHRINAPKNFVAYKATKAIPRFIKKLSKILRPHIGLSIQTRIRMGLNENCNNVLLKLRQSITPFKCSEINPARKVFKSYIYFKHNKCNKRQKLLSQDYNCKSVKYFLNLLHEIVFKKQHSNHQVIHKTRCPKPRTNSCLKYLSFQIRPPKRKKNQKLSLKVEKNTNELIINTISGISRFNYGQHFFEFENLYSIHDFFKNTQKKATRDRNPFRFKSTTQNNQLEFKYQHLMNHIKKGVYQTKHQPVKNYVHDTKMAEKDIFQKLMNSLKDKLLDDLSRKLDPSSELKKITVHKTDRLPSYNTLKTLNTSRDSTKEIRNFKSSIEILLDAAKILHSLEALNILDDKKSLNKQQKTFSCPKNQIDTPKNPFSKRVCLNPREYSDSQADSGNDILFSSKISVSKTDQNPLWSSLKTINKKDIDNDVFLADYFCRQKTSDDSNLILDNSILHGNNVFNLLDSDSFKKNLNSYTSFRKKIEPRFNSSRVDLMPHFSNAHSKTSFSLKTSTQSSTPLYRPIPSVSDRTNEDVYSLQADMQKSSSFRMVSITNNVIQDKKSKSDGITTGYNIPWKVESLQNSIYGNICMKHYNIAKRDSDMGAAEDRYNGPESQRFLEKQESTDSEYYHAQNSNNFFTLQKNSFSIGNKKDGIGFIKHSKYKYKNLKNLRASSNIQSQTFFYEGDIRSSFKPIQPVSTILYLRNHDKGFIDPKLDNNKSAEKEYTFSRRTIETDSRCKSEKSSLKNIFFDKFSLQTIFSKDLINQPLDQNYAHFLDPINRIRFRCDEMKKGSIYHNQKNIMFPQKTYSHKRKTHCRDIDFGYITLHKLLDEPLESPTKKNIQHINAVGNVELESTKIECSKTARDVKKTPFVQNIDEFCAYKYKPYTYPLQPFIFSSKNNKNLNRPFKCSINGCNKAYTSAFGLKYHAINGHNKIIDQSKPYKCTIEGCDKRYKNPNGLKYHFEYGHK